MKKFLLILLAISICVFSVSCKNNVEDVDNENAVDLSFLPLDFIYANGVGGWSSSFSLNQDGTFSGEYSDADLGTATEEYPGGVLYTCIYSGDFTNIHKVNDYTYSMTLHNLNSREELGKEWVEDGRLNIASEPFGIYGGSEFLLYTPDAPISELPEEFLNWWPMRFEKNLDKLGCYGIYNVSESCGFFSF